LQDDKQKATAANESPAGKLFSTVLPTSVRILYRSAPVARLSGTLCAERRRYVVANA
jgi:hypothetical protein